MSLYWYACISMNTDLYMIYDISLETIWWAFSNTSPIVWIHLAIHEILANKAFIVTDALISQLLVVTFVYSLSEDFQHSLVCENWSTSCEDTS